MADTLPSGTWNIRKWTLFTAIALIIGIILAAFIPQPVIGVIHLDDSIYSQSAQDMITQIQYARDHAQIRAVVLVINSPGGTVTDTESIYLELARLREKKPVVTMVESMAASGAYYLSVGTDYILAKPSSEVGNVGVIGYLPSDPTVMEELYSTGPYKLWGSPRDTFVREMEMMKQGFLQAVLLGRGDALKVTPEVILRGQIWPGAEALRMGLIDELGPQSRACEKAAQMAHVAHYRVEDLRPLSGLPEYTPVPIFGQASEEAQNTYPKAPGIYFLYVPPVEPQP